MELLGGSFLVLKGNAREGVGTVAQPLGERLLDGARSDYSPADEAMRKPSVSAAAAGCNRLVTNGQTLGSDSGSTIH